MIKIIEALRQVVLFLIEKMIDDLHGFKKSSLKIVEKPDPAYLEGREVAKKLILHHQAKQKELEMPKDIL